MARKDSYGDKGPKEDRKHLGGRGEIGRLIGLHRRDGSLAVYVETVAGKRLVSDSRDGGR